MEHKKAENDIVYIDNGGTFTDCVIVREDGTFVTGKADTTPDRLQDCFFNSIAAAAGNLGESLDELLPHVRLIGYGTTVGTNIVVSGKGGAKIGFVTSAGHEDRTLIMRLRPAGLSPKEGMNIVNADKPVPIVPKKRIRGIIERIDSQGEVVIPLDEDSARTAIKGLVDAGVEGIAVGFLWSFLNNSHETRISEIIKEMAPDMPMSLSSDVAPIIREYPRFMSTLIDLYIGRSLRELLIEIRAQLKKKGYDNPLLIMQAAGGLARSEIVKPVTTLHSGPVGGLTGVDFMRKLYGYNVAIGTDVGGTSFDVSISAEHGEEYMREPVVGRFEISNPMREIITVGAGGGTIAQIEPVTKILMVGPESAGASPGPICYDSGGVNPTVTDADIVMNRIDPKYFLGGTKKLNKEKVLRLMKEKIADPMGLSTEDAAEAICNIIDGKMQALLKTTLATKGIDPENTLVFAFGGMGATHCAAYTAKLGFGKVIIPPNASVFSAFGASTADVMHRYEASPFIMISDIPYDVTTLKFELDKLTSLDVMPSWMIERFNSLLEELETKAAKDMEIEGFSPDQVTTRYETLARYGGQLWEIRCPLPVTRINTVEDLRAIIRAFEEQYMDIYTREAMVPRGGIEIVSFSVLVSAAITKPNIVKTVSVGPDPSRAFKGARDVYFGGRWVSTGIYEMGLLGSGNVVEGPAVIESKDTTIVVPGDRKVVLDEFMNNVMMYR